MKLRVQLLLHWLACLSLTSVNCFYLNPTNGSPLRVRPIDSKLNYVDARTLISDGGSANQLQQYTKPPKLTTIKTPLKVGVLLLNLGGPETMKDVEGFLYNLFADPDIIRLPTILSLLQKPIAYVIAKRRAPKSSAAYLSIGGGSPIVTYTRAQAELIQSSLRKKGLKDAKCYFAMRYWNPYTEEVLNQMHSDGVNSVVILPLYPQYSISTSGSSLKLLLDIFQSEPSKWGLDKITHTVVPAWYHRPGYVKTMASMIVDVRSSHGNCPQFEVTAAYFLYRLPVYDTKATEGLLCSRDGERSARSVQRPRSSCELHRSGRPLPETHRGVCEAHQQGGVSAVVVRPDKASGHIQRARAAVSWRDVRQQWRSSRHTVPLVLPEPSGARAVATVSDVTI